MERQRIARLFIAGRFAFSILCLTSSQAVAETANISEALSGVLAAADASKILEPHMGSLKKLDASVFDIIVRRNWWSVARDLVAASHTQNADISIPVRKAVKTLKDEADELVRLLNPKYSVAQKVSPAFQWAQNDTCIFLSIKYTVRWNAPGSNTLTDKSVNIAGNFFNFSGLGQHSNYKYHYNLNMHLFDAIAAPLSSWNFNAAAKAGVTLRKLWPRKWPRLLSKKGAKVGDMHLWNEQQDKMETTLNGIQKAVNSPATCALDQKLYCLSTDTCKTADKCGDCQGKTNPNLEANQCVGIPTETASLEFKDADMDEFEIGGIVEIKKPKSDFDIDAFVVYFGTDDKTKLLLESGEAHVVGEAQSVKGESSVAIPLNTPIPAKATHLLVFSRNQHGEYEVAGKTFITDAVMPRSKPQGVTFSDEDGGRGVVGGHVQVQNAEDEEISKIDHYSLYWGKTATKRISKDDTITSFVPKSGGGYQMPKNTTIPKGAHYILAYSKNTHGEFPIPVSVKLVDNTKPCINASDADCPQGIKVEVFEHEIVVSVQAAKKEVGLDNYTLHWGRAPCTSDAVCFWRQTGGCESTGVREADKDMSCIGTIPNGASGFCDCDGDGKQGAHERGFSCKRSKGLFSCKELCKASAINGHIQDIRTSVDVTLDDYRVHLKRDQIKACEDTSDGATDLDGLGCSAYNGPEDNTQYNDLDFSANTMCCSAGGGKVVEKVPTGTTHVLAFARNRIGESDNCVSVSFFDEFAPPIPEPVQEPGHSEQIPSDQAPEAEQAKKTE